MKSQHDKVIAAYKKILNNRERLADWYLTMQFLGGISTVVIIVSVSLYIGFGLGG